MIFIKQAILITLFGVIIFAEKISRFSSFFLSFWPKMSWKGLPDYS
jgi:hypothetical protein